MRYADLMRTANDWTFPEQRIDLEAVLLLQSNGLWAVDLGRAIVQTLPCSVRFTFL